MTEEIKKVVTKIPIVEVTSGATQEKNSIAVNAITPFVVTSTDVQHVEETSHHTVKFLALGSQPGVPGASV